MLVPDEVRKCVAFLGYDKDGEFVPEGTGFFISRQCERVPNGHFSYLVTARHVVNKVAHLGHNHVLVRVNPRYAPAQTLETPVSEWVEHPDSSVDAMIYPDATSIMGARDHLSVPTTMFATTENLARHHTALGEGDDLFLTGLFTSHAKTQKNIPIVRTGTLAAMRHEKITWQNVPIDAYLVETRSFGGLSGSPVFVHYGSTQPHRTTGHNPVGVRFFLLGLMKGHYDDENAGLNKGIGVVVPVEKIVEVLEILKPLDDEEETNYLNERSRTHVGDPADFSGDDFIVALGRTANPLSEAREMPGA